MGILQAVKESSASKKSKLSESKEQPSSKRQKQEDPGNYDTSATKLSPMMDSKNKI
jgi:hypothetical protein